MGSEGQVFPLYMVRSISFCVVDFLVDKVFVMFEPIGINCEWV